MVRPFSPLLVSLASLCATALATSKSLGPAPGQINALVTFGDSYTDVGNPADGGQAWPVYAADYGHFALHPFAKSGATCNNNLTFRPFPPVFGSQLPTYFAEVDNKTLKLDYEKTIFTLWIGTNDVGSNALLTGPLTTVLPGPVTLVDVVSCAVDWVKVLYESGARNFLFQNMIPLQHTILYRTDSYFSRYWTDPRNSTEWSLFMTELTTSGNALSKLMLTALAPQLPGAHLGIFDSHGLFTDMLTFPENYLNGTLPANTTGCVHSCVFSEFENPAAGGNCTTQTGAAADSFLWYDELHPSEQADRQVARQITNAILRKSENWTTWLS